MKIEHCLGFAAGLTISAAAIAHGSPSFFSADHAQTWLHHLASGGLLSGVFTQQEAAAGGADSDHARWGD